MKTGVKSIVILMVITALAAGLMTADGRGIVVENAWWPFVVSIEPIGVLNRDHRYGSSRHGPVNLLVAGVITWCNAGQCMRIDVTPAGISALDDDKFRNAKNLPPGFFLQESRDSAFYNQIYNGNDVICAV